MEDSWPTCTGHLRNKGVELGVGDIYFVCGTGIFTHILS